MINIERAYAECIEAMQIKVGRQVMFADSATVSAGMVELPDGREAQVQITIQTDESEWIEE